MAKKTSKGTQAPNLYSDLVTDKKRAEQCIVIDNESKSYRFNTIQENHIVAQGIQKVWKNFDAFSNENKQTVLAYHEELFKEEPPKNQDIVITALMTWYKMCMKAEDRTTKPVSQGGDRKSHLGTRLYIAQVDESGAFLTPGNIKTPQAIACLKILQESVTELPNPEHDPKDKKSSPTWKAIKEEDLKAKVIERAQELKTRQDPWRIFQYYRPQLIAGKLLRTV